MKTSFNNAKFFPLSFRKFIRDSDDEDAERGSGEEGESQLLTRRIKTQEEKVRNGCL